MRVTEGDRWLVGFALTAAPTYAVAVLLGGLAWPGYSWMGESVSTLTSSGAPNQLLMVPLLSLYNLGLVAGGVALWRSLPVSEGRTWGPFFLTAAGIDGLVLFRFPQDPWGAPVSPIGSLHILVAGLGALFLLLAMGFLWRSTRRDPEWAGLSRLTAILLVCGIVLGAWGAVSISTSYAGLAERISIGTFLLWIELVSIDLARRLRARSTTRLGAVASGALAV